MKRTWLAGLLIAVLAVVAILLSDWLSLGLGNVLLGIGAGAVVALVPDHSPGWRIGSFVIGLVVAWLMYGLSAGLLPSSTTSSIIVAVLSVLLVTVAAGVSRGRLPLWAGLVGIVGMVGAYQAAYDDKPYLFLTESVTAVSVLLVTVALGFVAVVIADLVGGASATADADTQPELVLTTEV